jgi:Flp pilus assembly protein TadG
MKVTKTDERHEGGQSLTELAIMMVFLLIMLAGVVDVGRAFFSYIAIRDGAQEGALVGSIDPANDCTVITNRVRESSNFPVDMSDNTIITVDCRLPASYCVGEEVGVSVSYVNFPLIMPFMGTLLGSQTVTITASITDTIVTNDPNVACP